MNAMKKIYSIIFAAAAIFAASSCQEEIVEPDLGTQENESMTITAGFGAETKTVLDGLKTYWTEGDQISVFDSNKKESDTDGGNNRCFSIDEATEFEDGKAISATFKYEGEFVWPQNDQPDPLVVALYPYQENAYCDFFDAENNCITGLEIPAEQVALADGFDATATFALAASTYSNKDNLHFTNLYSLLRITIDEEGVQQVKVEFTGGNIAGEAKVQLDLTEGETPVFNGGTLSVTEKGTNVVTLTCQDGFTQDEDYYIAIAPVTYTNIKVYLDDVLVKDTTPAQPKTLEPNTVYNIKDLDQPDDRGLSFPKAEYTAFLGNEFTAPVVSSEIEGATDGVTYSSSEEEVATVDENTGAVTILAVGETVITATAPQTTEYNEATATYTLVVSEKADRELQFSETSVTVTLGDTFTAPELTGTTEGVTYASSNEEVATVDGEGNVTIEGAGETTITASADANETHLAGSAEYTLTVNKAERTLTFSASTFTATVGDSFTPPILTGTPDPSGVKYTSSNTGVATVDENTGAVELVGAGETTITASADETETHLAGTASYTLTVEIAEFQPQEGYIYLKPSTEWKSANARFAAYFFNQTWKDMTLVKGQLDIYQCEIPEGETNVIFCRMNPNTEENRWNTESDTEETKPLWSQTSDLTMLNGCLYTVSGWNDGAWSGEAAVDPVDAKEAVVGFSGIFGGVESWGDNEIKTAEYTTVNYTDESIFAGTYTFELTDFELAANDKFKVRVNGAWIGSGNASVTGISLGAADNDGNFVVSGAGTYDVTVNFSWDGANYSNVNVQFVKQGGTDPEPEPEPEQTYRICLHKNWNWSDIHLYGWIMNTDTSIFGTWPGKLPDETETIGSETYLYWNIPEEHVGKTVGLIIYGKDNGTAKEPRLENVVLNQDYCYKFEWTSEKGDHLIPDTK